MAEISGLNGAITIGSFTNTTATLKQWSITYSQAAIDTTVFGDTARTKVPGIKEFRGTARGVLDGSTAPDTLPTAAVSATFTATSGKTYAGDVVVTELSPDVVVDGEASFSISFEGSGDLTIA